ncbi:SDR family NAD(P)-dependent oxidoreductase [Kineococcus terrestris]|uniref:SDR family NAD(P)-dependent oxidoreductase n=1 Tax=Kineococcus terrestris TaxID=2044856 RepID=UPI0034DAE5FB
MHFHGRTALVTGASTGIGEHLAAELAARGADLVVVARSGDRLRALAERLGAAHGRRVDVVTADLAEPGAGARVVAEVERLGVTVDVLVNNAGFALSGPVAGAARDTGVDRLVSQVQVNCTALVDLTARLLPGMVDRRSGVVLNVASTAAFQPVPNMAVYAATKAFVLSFTEALWVENRRTGVRVLAVCPGPTETPFFDTAGQDSVGDLPRRTATDVVATAMGALDGSGPTVVDGPLNKVTAAAPRFAPRRVTALLSKVVTTRRGRR